MIERAKQSTILSAAFHFGHRALIHVYGFRIRSNDPERPSPATVAERTGSENSGAPWKGGAVIAVIEILLIFFCLAAFAGQLPPDVNESHYLTKAKHYFANASERFEAEHNQDRAEETHLLSKQVY